MVNNNTVRNNVSASSNNTNTNTNTGIDMNANMTEFNTAFAANYSEVSSLINFGEASSLLNFEGKGKSFAEIIADRFFNIVDKEAFYAKRLKTYKNISEEKLASQWSIIEKRNNKFQARRDQFLNLFSSKLGNLNNVAIVQTKHTGKFSQLSHEVLSFFKDNYSLVIENKDGSMTFMGQPYVEGTPVIAQSYHLWIGMLCAATYNLTAQERAQFIGLLFANSSSSETVASRNGISFDFLNATATTSNSRVLKANKATVLGKAGTPIVVDGNHAIFMLALSIFAGTDNQVEVRINYAVSLFAREHNYGYSPDADDIASVVSNNLLLSNSSKLINDKCFNFEIKTCRQSSELLGWCLSRGVIAASDKTNIHYITINDGAEAMGLGWDKEQDVILSISDANKAAKLINRPASLNYNFANVQGRVASKFGFYLNASGNVAKTKGKMMKVAFTNSKLGFGSGVAAINQDACFEYSVPKTEKQTFNMSIFGFEHLNNKDSLTTVLSLIKEQIEAVKGQTFAPKAIIIEITVDEQVYKLVNNSSIAADIVVNNGDVVVNAVDANAIEVSLQIELVAKTQWVKTRRLGTKFTTLPYAIEFVGVDAQWDIFLNNECTKGQGALVEMFANASGVDHVLHTAQGKLVSAEGIEINLLDANNAVQQWKEANRLENVSIRMEIAKSVFNSLVKVGEAEKDRSFFDSITVISETETSVLVEETIDVIFGELVFDVEISTALENVSRSNLTLESAAAIALQDKELGEIFINECAAKTNQFVNLAASVKKQNSKVVIDVRDVAQMSRFFAAIYPNGYEKSNQRSFLSKIATVAANDLEITLTDNVSVIVNPAALSIFGSFSSVSGSACRETATVVNFLMQVILNNVKEFNVNDIYQVNKAHTKALDTPATSEKVLKTATCSGELVYGKVRTSYHPALHSVDGIPTIILNKKCPLVRLLNIKQKEVNKELFIGFARTPMPFLGVARVKLTNDDSLCGIAHAVLDPYVWHALNEGDSDGDGIALMNLQSIKGYEVNAEKAQSINKSKMGMGGYEFLYGSEVPFIDFISEKDKQTKKSLRGDACLLNFQISDPSSGEKVNISSSFLGHFAKLVSEHYMSAVGIGYGICSKLVFDAVDSLYEVGAEARFNNLVDACLVAWRSIYEGLGLSGYSPEAYMFFHLLNVSSVDIKGLQVHSPNRDWKNVDVVFNGVPAEAMPANILIQKALKDISGIDLSFGACDELIIARCVTRVVPKLEGFSELKQWWAPVVPSAVKFGTLRRISQGSQRVCNELGIREAELGVIPYSYVNTPIVVLFNQASGAEVFSHALLGSMTQEICSFLSDLTEVRRRKLDAERGFDAE